MFKKERKSWIILFCVIMIPFFCIVIVPFTLYSIGHFTVSIKKVYETNWGITLPDGINLLNDRQTRSFHGDGIRHTVYSIYDKEDYFSDFETVADNELEKTCLNIIASLQVEKIYAPDFKKEYVWKKYTKYNNALIVIYISEKKELHLFQWLG